MTRLRSGIDDLLDGVPIPVSEMLKDELSILFLQNRVVPIRQIYRNRSGRNLLWKDDFLSLSKVYD